MSFFEMLHDHIRGLILGFKLGRNAIERCALTGLQTQQMYQLRGRTQLERRSQRYFQTSIIFCDVQNFKMVNDQLSHSVGDLLLSKIGNRAVQFFRKEDTEGIRPGGDEMVIVMLGAPYETAEDKARLLQKLVWIILQSFEFRQEVAKLLEREGRPDRIPNIKRVLDLSGLNVGVATGIEGTSIEALTAEAEAEMEKDKATNKARKPWATWGRQ